MRADVYLQQNGYAPSRKQAQDLIASGNVTIDGSRIVKCSAAVDENLPHNVTVASLCPYVSRGGYKLAGALDAFGIDVTGLVALDVGASTGGFTDCLLQRGAARVIALDAGHGQLHEKLLHDSRVIPIEGYNARALRLSDLPERPGIVVMDVSFISQTLILPGIASVLEDGGLYVGLIKPQFEVGRNAVGKGGIVRSAEAREDAVKRVVQTSAQLGLSPVSLIRSPIEGGDGNVEYLILCKKGGMTALDESEIHRILTAKGGETT